MFLYAEASTSDDSAELGVADDFRSGRVVVAIRICFGVLDC